MSTQAPNIRGFEKAAGSNKHVYVGVLAPKYQKTAT
jgi:hypothetical protein